MQEKLGKLLALIYQLTPMYGLKVFLMRFDRGDLRKVILDFIE